MTKERRHGQIRQEGAEQRQESEARAQGRHAEERAMGKEGEEPQTGDRHRIVGGQESRRKGPEKIVVEKEGFIQEEARSQKEGVIQAEVFRQKQVFVRQEEVVTRQLRPAG